MVRAEASKLGQDNAAFQKFCYLRFLLLLSPKRCPESARRDPWVKKEFFLSVKFRAASGKLWSLGSWHCNIRRNVADGGGVDPRFGGGIGGG